MKYDLEHIQQDKELMEELLKAGKRIDTIYWKDGSETVTHSYLYLGSAIQSDGKKVLSIRSKQSYMPVVNVKAILLVDGENFDYNDISTPIE